MSQYMLSSAATFGFFMSIGSVGLLLIPGQASEVGGEGLTNIGNQDGFTLSTTSGTDEAIAGSVTYCYGMAQSG